MPVSAIPSTVLRERALRQVHRRRPGLGQAVVGPRARRQGVGRQRRGAVALGLARQGQDATADREDLGAAVDLRLPGLHGPRRPAGDGRPALKIYSDRKSVV